MGANLILQADFVKLN